MDILTAFRTLIRVAEAGSFSAVARELGVTQPAISRQVAALEQHFHLRLLHRTTHSLTLTDDGARLLEEARHILDSVDMLRETAAHHGVRVAGHVRLAVSVTLALHLAARTGALLARHPELSLELVTTDHLPDLVHDGLDLAVTLGLLDPAHAGSVVARRIGAIRLVLVAAPAYLATRPAPTRPGDLAAHDCIILTGRPEAQDWHFSDGETEQVATVSGRFRADNRESVHAAAIAGQGLALLSPVRARAGIASGALIPLMPGWQSPEAPIHVVYPSRRNLPARTRTVIEFLASEARLMDDRPAA